VGVGVGFGVAVGVGEGIGVGVAEGDGVGVAVGLGEGDGVEDGVGLGGTALAVVGMDELTLPHPTVPSTNATAIANNPVYLNITAPSTNNNSDAAEFLLDVSFF
jgi:hypothetical protein